MTWTQLQADGIVQTHVATKAELDELRSLVERNISDAGVLAVSPDNRLGMAYAAILALSKMLVHAAGYRLRGRGGAGHLNTLDAAETALGATDKALFVYFDGLRRQRNALSYDAAGGVTKPDAEKALQAALKFRETVET